MMASDLRHLLDIEHSSHLKTLTVLVICPWFLPVLPEGEKNGVKTNQFTDVSLPWLRIHELDGLRCNPVVPVRRLFTHQAGDTPYWSPCSGGSNRIPVSYHLW